MIFRCFLGKFLPFTQWFLNQSFFDCATAANGIAYKSYIGATFPLGSYSLAIRCSAKVLFAQLYRASDVRDNAVIWAGLAISTTFAFLFRDRRGKESSEAVVSVIISRK